MVGSSATHPSTSDSKGGVFRVGMIDGDIIGKSSRKLVMKGRLFNCVREGEKVAVTFPLFQTVSSKETCENIQEKCSELRRMVKQLNSYRDRTTGIKVDSPDMVRVKRISSWMSKKIGLKLGDDDWVTVEERLRPDFRLFIDSQGHVNKHTSNVDALEELVHYSYHVSDGNFVVCELQGVTEGTSFHLSESTIHSLSRFYGDSDAGEAGIASVFRNHRCTGMCKDWRRPLTRSSVQESRFVPSAPPLTAVLPKQQLTQPKIPLYKDTLMYHICDNQDPPPPYTE